MSRVIPSLEPAHASALATAYARSGASRWQVPASALATAIEVAVAHRFGHDANAGSEASDRSTPRRSQIDAFIASLHVEDLALACACSEGHAEAWEHFVLTYRPELYRAARAMCGHDDHRELADSLYAELYGLPGPDGRRRSLLTYYHGRSKLSTWMRSVLAQRHIDRVRVRPRTVPLDDRDSSVPEPSAAPDPDRSARAAAVSASIATALASLDPRDRLRVAYYYVHELTLAQIGRLLGEHEATVSRKLDKARQGLKAAIEAALRERGVDPAEIDDWGHAARHDWSGQLADLVDQSPLQADPPGSFKGGRTP